MGSVGRWRSGGRHGTIVLWSDESGLVTTGTASSIYHRRNGLTDEYLQSNLSSWSATPYAHPLSYVAGLGWTHLFLVPTSAEGYVVTLTATHSVVGDDGAYKESNLVENVEKLVWDEPLTGATHNVATSAGRRLRQINAFSQVDATVDDVAASSSSFVTDLTASVDETYHHLMIVFTSGALIGQAFPILSYAGSTKRITVDGAFTSAPANGDEFSIVSIHIHPLASIADSVWDEATSGHATAGTFGKLTTDISALLIAIQGSGFNASTDTLEKLRDAVDALEAARASMQTTLVAEHDATQALLSGIAADEKDIRLEP